MFISMLAVTFVISLIVSLICVKFFTRPIEGILKRIIPEDISAGWVKYMKFAIYVSGISSGVRVWKMERYLDPIDKIERQTALVMDTNHWILEVYRAVIDALQGIAWMLLAFFIFALLAYVIVRIFEAKRENAPSK